ncbi:unnamed protein product [Meloidogyne enterolobii]|uniref:Uncharacterized protein n=1 Tax=Meloidogyne enterolobii TaxID=390850 RepID=A0ACB0ZXD0_MELEN
MSDSSRNSSGGPAMRLSSLTVGQFWKAVENFREGFHIDYLSMYGKRWKSLLIWNEMSSKDPLPVNEFMEEFLRDGAIAFNQRKRAYKLHEAMPLIENRTVKLSVRYLEVIFVY